MGKLTKKQKAALEHYDAEKIYDLKEAAEIVKKVSTEKFDASVDLAMRLGVDPRKANEMVRGTVSLPHGTGKDVRVLVLCTPDKEEEAKAAGADHVGLDDYVAKIKGGWTDVDVIITMPSVMGKVGALGRILGPRGLMPNPKVGTVTPHVDKAVDNVKKGQVQFRSDKGGVLHCIIGKLSFQKEDLIENMKELISVVSKLRPASAKGIFLKKISLSSTMGPGLTIDVSFFK